jgi:hypothetical protein
MRVVPRPGTARVSRPETHERGDLRYLDRRLFLDAAPHTKTARGTMELAAKPESRRKPRGRHGTEGYVTPEIADQIIVAIREYA